MRSDDDSRRLAATLQRAHAQVTGGADTSEGVRVAVARSWDRSVAAGVNPEAPAPRILDDTATRQRFAKHRLGEVFSRLQSSLFRVTHDGDHLAALSDADGTLLWADGSARMLEAAVRPRFLPGHSCNELAVGTNAIGTALALDHPIQIFSAEHFARRLHTWTCAASPVHEPHTGAIVGALNLSSRARDCNPDTVGLVEALARTIELELAVMVAALDERLRSRFLAIGHRQRTGTLLVNGEGRVLFADPPSWIGGRVERLDDPAFALLPDGCLARWEPFGTGFLLRREEGERRLSRPAVVITRLGRRDLVVEVGEREIRLSPRHSDIILALARHPHGLSPEELSSAVYGSLVSPVTLRAELSRLRRLLGPVVASSPYRLDAEISMQDRTL